MALPTNPVASSTTTTLTPVAGSDRIVVYMIAGESGFTGTLTDATYGPAGPSAFRIESFPLAGNQMWFHLAFFDEADIAGRTSDVITPTWDPSAPPSSITYVLQYNDVDQGVPVNDFVTASNASGGIASPPDVDALDGGVVVLSVSNGNAGTFTWTNYTQQNTQGSGFSQVTATQAIASAATVATEYDNDVAANRSSLYAYALNETGSVGVSITDVNGGNPFAPGDTNILIDGLLFEALQGTGFVTISPTDDVNDILAVDINSVNSWSDSQISVDISPAISLLYGEVFIFVTTDSAESNPNGFMSDLEPPSGRTFITIHTQSDSTRSLLADTTGIEFDADQLEYDTTSEQGGTVYVEISGDAYIQYAGTPPDTDTIFARLGDKSDETWSSNTLEEILINQTGGGGSGPIEGLDIEAFAIEAANIQAIEI